MLLIFQCIFHSEYASPRIAEHKKVRAVGANGLSHLLYLFHKTLCGPQAAVGGLVAVIRPKLIILVKLKAFAQEERFKAFHVFVCHGRTTMQQQYFDARIAPKTLSPNVERANRRLNWNHAHAAGFDGVGVGEVGGE